MSTTALSQYQHCPRKRQQSIGTVRDKNLNQNCFRHRWRAFFSKVFVNTKKFEIVLAVKSSPLLSRSIKPKILRYCRFKILPVDISTITLFSISLCPTTHLPLYELCKFYGALSYTALSPLFLCQLYGALYPLQPSVSLLPSAPIWPSDPSMALRPLYDPLSPLQTLCGPLPSLDLYPFYGPLSPL